MKILVVDDIGYTRHCYMTMLNQHGYASVAAQSGAEALNLLKTDHSISVVITDLVMREMDGIDLFRQTQHLERISDEGPVEPPAFILMTALHPGKNAEPRDVERIKLAEQLGFIDVLFKPIEPGKLVAAIKMATQDEDDSDMPKLKHQTKIIQELAYTIGITKNPEEAGSLLRDMRETIDQIESILAEPV